jgi:hypothetical protein
MLGAADGKAPGGASREQPGHLLRLPHDVLIDLFARLKARSLVCLASTCRLLQHSQSSAQTPNSLEDALRLRACLRGWSRTLPVDARGAIRHLLRLAWQDDLEFQSICAGRSDSASFFVDSGDSLRTCGMELQYRTDDDLGDIHA